MTSTDIIIEAPFSFTGSAKRLARYGRHGTPQKVLSIMLTLVCWAFIVCWYATWGIFLVPYRLVRRSDRKQKRDELRHAEMLAAVHQPADVTMLALPAGEEPA